MRGQTIHPYDSESVTYHTSAGLVLGVCVILAPLVVLFAWFVESASGIQYDVLLVIIAFLTAFLLWMLLRLGETVIVDTDGIERRTPLLGRSRVRWADVIAIDIIDAAGRGRAFRLTSDVTGVVRIGDFLTQYEDVLSEALARVPARALAIAFVDGSESVRERLIHAITGRSAVDADIARQVREFLVAHGFEGDAAVLEQRVVAWPRTDVIDSGSKHAI